MSVIILLVLFSLLLAVAFLGAFIISMRSGQFDDTSTPQIRMLFDTKKPTSEKEDGK